MSADTIRFTRVEDFLADYAGGINGTISVHLDSTGTFTCQTHKTDTDSLAAWAANPHRLTRTFEQTEHCGNRWVIFVCQNDAPTEGDVHDYTKIQIALADKGIELVDCIISWGGDRAVSMHYLRHRTSDYRDLQVAS